ncbi:MULTISPECIES: thiol-disulfide oxidoreductase DCC family protein [Priestia]|jgi:predicted DCC family thiol-disulfide oxidoreductase YuxK|uniref:Thiol-disulfide oxidoreductase DCC family protein n=3 Tax=Priestia TaxID=2800373 RepID=A0AAX6BIF3_PRIMG|nr:MULTISPECIES: thiol-disulfide oxidoreductase DCC family protein [Priestia]MBK0291908.1 thiol-disulfide oxidoreductase DCC family protein [Bacillus sp. S34]MBU8853229.1 thiol-disulfide oxidoreductase DCC family protein [Bacillus sp. FJAT-26377]MCL9634425.1 thiol-disulfide oxidoreductase DCC family protein [Bacillus zanthoxyli]NHH95041.1 hypothetical protein [Bacillus sp. MB95]UPK48280.1 thiol-disulfide oxidoreductase DCC family protein [Bacillus sp. H8-1]
MKHLILFDGICNLCNSSVQFIIKHDEQALFSFASLQSDFGKQQLASHGLLPEQLDSIVYIHGKQRYIKSTAALKIAKRLDGPVKFLYALIIIPAPIRDIVYNWIARNRYKWFGKQQHCMLPTSDTKKRFVDD